MNNDTNAATGGCQNPESPSEGTYTVSFSEISNALLLYGCTPELLQDILDHIRNPSSWASMDDIIAIRLERDALMEDLRGTSSVCGDASIHPRELLDGYACDHLDLTRILAFGRRTSTNPTRCPHWVWRGPQQETTHI